MIDDGTQGTVTITPTGLEDLSIPALYDVVSTLPTQQHHKV